MKKLKLKEKQRNMVTIRLNDVIYKQLLKVTKKEKVNMSAYIRAVMTTFLKIQH